MRLGGPETLETWRELYGPAPQRRRAELAIAGRAAPRYRAVLERRTQPPVSPLPAAQGPQTLALRHTMERHRPSQARASEGVPREENVAQHGHARPSPHRVRTSRARTRRWFQAV